LREAGVYTHLVTDHLHYFEDGGATYHGRFASYDFIRGQEYDPWKAMVQPPVERLRERFSEKHYGLDADNRLEPHKRGRLQHAINSEWFVAEEDYPGPRCFKSAFEFLDTNRRADNWFLMVECFDPHEPFQAPERFKEAYATGYNGGILDWPHYERATGSAEEIAEIRANYAALVAMCDENFGKLLDYFDAHDLWRDTALILSTDHGFLLAEHDWWGKNLEPYYQEIAHIPLIIHHPGIQAAGERRQALTQTYDLMPTFLDLFGIAAPPEVQGASILPHMRKDGAGRAVGIFGMFGGPIGATDGRYAFYLYPPDLAAPGLHEYTLMPMHLNSMFSTPEMETARLVGPFDFTKRMPLLKVDALMDARRIPIHDGRWFEDVGTRLFDLATDPQQVTPFRDSAIEARLMDGIAAVLRGHDAPVEIFGRYGLHHAELLPAAGG
jgi:arylsulfatase A-like enzyme